MHATLQNEVIVLHKNREIIANKLSLRYEKLFTDLQRIFTWKSENIMQ